MQLTKKTKIIVIIISTVVVAIATFAISGNNSQFTKFFKGGLSACDITGNICSGDCGHDSCGGGSWCVRNSLPGNPYACTTPCTGCAGRCDDARACNLPGLTGQCAGGARGEDGHYCVAKEPELPTCAATLSEADCYCLQHPDKCIGGCPSGPLGDLCRCLKFGEGCYVNPPMSNTITADNSMRKIITPGKKVLLTSFDVRSMNGDNPYICDSMEQGDITGYRKFDKSFCNAAKIIIQKDSADPNSELPNEYITSLSLYELAYGGSLENENNQTPNLIKKDCQGHEIRIDTNGPATFSNDEEKFDTVDFSARYSDGYGEHTTINPDYLKKPCTTTSNDTIGRGKAKFGLFATIREDAPVTKKIKIKDIRMEDSEGNNIPTELNEAGPNFEASEIDGGYMQTTNNTQQNPLQILQYEKPPAGILLDLDFKTTEGGAQIKTLKAHFEKLNGESIAPNFNPDDPESAGIKIFKQRRVNEGEQIQTPVQIINAEIKYNSHDNNLTINFPEDDTLSFSRDTTTRVFIEGTAGEVDNPTKEFHLKLNPNFIDSIRNNETRLHVDGDFKKTKDKPDCPDINFDGIDDNDLTNPCYLRTTSVDIGLSNVPPQLGPPFKIIPPQRLKIESEQWPATPVLVRQNRTNIQFGEIKATSSYGDSVIKEIKVNLDPGSSGETLDNAFQNLKVTNASGAVLNTTITQESNILTIKFNPRYTIRNNTTETLKLVTDIKTSVQEIEFTAKIESSYSISQDENHSARIQLSENLQIGPQIKIPIYLTINSIKTAEQLPYFSESDEPFEIAKLRFSADKSLEINRLYLTLKDDAPGNATILPYKMPFSKIKELKIYDEDNTMQELCTVTLNVSTKKAVADCSSFQLNDNAPRTLIIMAKLNYGVVNGQKFTLGIANEADIVADKPILTAGIPAFGPEFTSSGNAAIEIRAAGDNAEVAPNGDLQSAKLITIKFKTTGGDASIVKKLKKIVLNKTTVSNFDSSKIGELHLYKTDRSEYRTVSFGGDLVSLTKNSIGQITIEFPTDENGIATQMNNDQEISLSAEISPSGADKDKILQYFITSVDIEPVSVSKIIVQADGPKITFGARVCQNGKIEKSNGTCECPDRTTEYTDQPTKYSLTNGNVCIPCNPETDLITVDGVLMCKQDRPIKMGSLLITARLPDGQNTSLAQGNNTVKAIEIDMAKTGGDLLGDQLKRFTLEYDGDFDKTKLFEPELWRTGDANVQLTDEQITITPSTTTGLYTVIFKTPLVIGNTKKLIFYVRTTVADTDTGKKFRYKVTGVETEPNTPISKIYMSGDASPGPQFIVPNSPTLTVINNIINDDVALPALPYCESIGRYTYIGRDIPGLLYGNCIDCPNDTFNSLSGRCEIAKVANEGGGDGGEQNTTQQSPAPDTQIVNTPSGNSSPDLRGSARLVAIPNQGNTGPEIALYFGAIGITYAAMWFRKKRRNK